MNQIEKVTNINLTLLKETEKLTIFKRDKIKLELKSLANSRQLSKYGRTSAPLLSLWIKGTESFKAERPIADK